MPILGNIFIHSIFVAITTMFVVHEGCKRDREMTYFTN